jgi:FkbH-like protein
MKLAEALAVVNKNRTASGPPFEVFLTCGFTPLHLSTFLTARLVSLLPGRHVSVRSGVYGDLIGSLDRLAVAAPRPVTAIVIEWSDLDPRLGIRRLGGWGADQLLDVVRSVEASVESIQGAIERLPSGPPIVVCTPTLPLPPVFHTASWQAEALETELSEMIAHFTARLARDAHLRIVSRQRLDRMSPLGERFDARSELRSGFPYRIAHADALAEVLAALIETAQPKKGIITDLDDTLWSGILGEDGVAAVSWDQPASTIHGIYQQFLSALSERGVLVGVASRNDPGLVDEVFRRPDLLLSRDRVYPIRATWGAKSESVRDILRAWNVAADTLVFVDDSPLELAEVQAAHPGIECALFRKDDPQEVWLLLERLRDLFGKPVISEADRLRVDSLRDRAEVPGAAASAAADEFLEQVGAAITIDYRKNASDARPLELLNKTNQFNLNGRRYTDQDWHAHLARHTAFLLRVSYRDKFGPLGEIATLTGHAEPSGVRVDGWVLSCRAFARRIEHQCLGRLFARFGVDSLTIDYQPTERNGPFQEFLGSIGPVEDLGQPPRLARERFEAACPPLYHEVHEITDE